MPNLPIPHQRVGYPLRANLMNLAMISGHIGRLLVSSLRITVRRVKSMALLGISVLRSKDSRAATGVKSLRCFRLLPRTLILALASNSVLYLEQPHPVTESAYIHVIEV